MQEDELIAIVDKIANRFASTFKFGYHELEDMKQQAWQVALEGLKDYDGKRPLENFLWTHVRNRLYNFKRDNYFRPEKPCDRCPLLVNDVCTKFKDRLECDLYSRWEKRTEKRKSLMTAVEHTDTNYNENDIDTCRSMAKDINVTFKKLVSSRWGGIEHYKPTSKENYLERPIEIGGTGEQL